MYFTVSLYTLASCKIYTSIEYCDSHMTNYMYLGEHTQSSLIILHYIKNIIITVVWSSKLASTCMLKNNITFTAFIVLLQENLLETNGTQAMQY